MSCTLLCAFLTCSVLRSLMHPLMLRGTAIQKLVYGLCWRMTWFVVVMGSPVCAGSAGQGLLQ